VRISSPPIGNDLRTRQRLLVAALQQLAESGLQPGLVTRAAAAIGCDLPRAEKFFRRDEEVVLALYARFATDLEEKMLELPTGTVAERFSAMMQSKLSLLSPHRAALASLAGAVLDPRSGLGPLHPQMEIIRSRVRGVITAVATGASDGNLANPTIERALYAVHLSLILLWTQDHSEDQCSTQAALKLACDLFGFLTPFLALEEARPTFETINGIVTPLVDPPESPDLVSTAEEVLRRLYRHRRIADGACRESPCAQCFALHLPRVKYFLHTGQPLHFVLPAFPAKSPSRRKTLGPLPDMAETLALHYLEEIASELQPLHGPGACVTICSDGHVFADLVSVPDDAVTRYGEEIRTRIRASSGDSLNTFDMSDLYDTADFSEMRRQLVMHYAHSLESVQTQIDRFDHARTQYNGIHRFLFEEQSDIQVGVSRTKVREECKSRAIEVIQRSAAWSRLLADCFPSAIRLSIHPQHPHSAKIGILLGDAGDLWQTPWHGVALNRAGVWSFVKRHEAESLGATLVDKGGANAHFALP